MKTAILFSLIFVLCACAQNKWAPAGPNTSAADFEPTKAKCSYISRHGGTSFIAAGDPNFVAGAALGNSITNAVNEVQDFNDCMVMNGWIQVKQ
jgi:hypothetical protein